MSSYNSETEYSPDPGPLHESFIPKKVVQLHHIQHPQDMPEENDEEQDLSEQHFAPTEDENHLCKVQTPKDTGEARTRPLEKAHRTEGTSHPQPISQVVTLQDEADVAFVFFTEPIQQTVEITLPKRSSSPWIGAEGSNLEHYGSRSSTPSNLLWKAHQDQKLNDHSVGWDRDRDLD